MCYGFLSEGSKWLDPERRATGVAEEKYPSPTQVPLFTIIEDLLNTEVGTNEVISSTTEIRSTDVLHVLFLTEKIDIWPLFYLFRVLTFHVVVVENKQE